jgi:hypothetical protein
VIYPSHYVTQHTLYIVIEVSLDLFLTQLTAITQWNRKNVIDTPSVITLELGLDARNTNVVVMRCV